MELDLKTVRALSSPTRLRILSELKEDSSTPTRLSDTVEKSKSTVTSHLQVLHEAGLVRREDPDGRRRVVYESTRHAKHILDGREKKVRFSLGSSAVTGLLGLISLGAYMNRTGSGGMETADASQLSAETAANAGAENVLFSPEILLAVGLALVSFSVVSFGLGVILRRI